MSDLFHKDVPVSYIRQVFEVIADTPQHQYQVLTKRSKRLADIGPRLDWPPNLWMGVSVESTKYRFRLDHLRQVDAAVRFVSAEPLLGPLEDLDLDGIHWLIAGGESGPRARPMDARVGPRSPRPVPRRGRALLLQAVGRPHPEGRWSRTRRPHLRRDAAAR